MAAQYDGAESYGVRTLYDLVRKRATMRGFLVSDHLDRMADFRKEVGASVREGAVVHDETVVDGIEHAAEALLDLLGSGRSAGGKVVVRVGGAA